MNKLAYLLLLPLASAHSRTAVPASAGLPPMTAKSSEGLSLRPVKWSLVGGNRTRQIIRGRTVPITLQADIAKGWHIYSLTQKPGGPIALRLELIGAADVIMRGLVDAPKPERIFDKNFGIETELYSGSPRFTIPVGVPGRTLGGIRKFQIGARYQVCSEKLCLPPRTDKLDVTLRIAGPK